MTHKDYLFSFEPSQSLGCTKLFTSYKLIEDNRSYDVIFSLRGWEGKRVYGPSRLFHLF